MMKRWLWWTVIGLCLAFIFVGYGVTKRVETAKSYKSALELGQAYVNDGNYAAAKVSFQDALKKKPNDKTAKVYLEQTKCYEKGLDQIEDKQYSKARTSFQQVALKNYGLGILVKRASEKQMELKEVITQLKNFEQIYARADSLAKNYEYTSSNTQLAVVLGYGSIRDNYYEDVFQKAQALKRSNDAKLRALGYNVQPPVEDELNAAQLAQQNNISKEELKQANVELKKNGVNITDLDDKQVIKVILQARDEQKSIAELAEEYKWGSSQDGPFFVRKMSILIVIDQVMWYNKIS